jgi:hypothetical protein
MVDHEDLDRSFAGLETQAHLVAESGEDRGAVCVRLCFVGHRVTLYLDYAQGGHAERQSRSVDGV